MSMRTVDRMEERGGGWIQRGKREEGGRERWMGGMEVVRRVRWGSEPLCTN